MALGFRDFSSAGNGRLVTGGEELGGYAIGEEAESILKDRGEDSKSRRLFGPDFDRNGVADAD